MVALLKKTQIIFLLLLFVSCTKENALKLNQSEKLAIERAVLEYVSNDINRDIELMVFEKKYRDKAISIYEYSSFNKNNIDTLKCNVITEIHNRTVIIINYFDNPSEVYIGNYSLNNLVTEDSPQSILIINNETGLFQIINFGQKYLPFYNKICEIQYNIEKIRFGKD